MQRKKKSEKNKAEAGQLYLAKAKQATGQRSGWGEQRMQDFIRTRAKKSV